jgi:hypothetical protein
MKHRKSISGVEFKTGTKVICINDDFSNVRPLYKIIFRFPVAGEVYTIRGKYDAESIWLKEVINEVMRFPFGKITEPSFFNWRFRLYVEDKIEAEEALKGKEFTSLK